LPELSRLSTPDLANPAETPPLLGFQLNFKLGVDYPEPIVDPELSFKAAQQKIFEWRNRPSVQRAAQGVYQRHGSRKKQ